MINLNDIGKYPCQICMPNIAEEKYHFRHEQESRSTQAQKIALLSKAALAALSTRLTKKQQSGLKYLPRYGQFNGDILPIKLFRNIPAQQQKELATLLSPFIDRHPDLGLTELQSIADAYLAIPEEDRSDCTTFINLLANIPRLNIDIIVSFINFLNQIEANHREVISTLLIALIKEEVASAINASSSEDPIEQERRLQERLYLSSSVLKVYIKRYLALIPENERADFATFAKPLLNLPKIEASLARYFIELFHNTPATQRNEIVTQVTPLIQLLGTTCDSQVDIHKMATMYLTASDQASLLKLLTSCIANCKHHYTIKKIFFACLTIPVEDRVPLGAFVAPLILANCNNSDEISDFILACHKLPITEREPFALFIAPLITNIKNNAPIADIITTVCKLNSLKRTEFIAPLNSLLSFYMPSTSTAFKNMSELPPDELTLLMQLIPTLVSNDDSSQKIGNLLEVLTLFPSVALPNLQLHLQEILNVPEKERLLLLNTLVYMHPTDWHGFITKTRSELPQDVETRSIRGRNYLYGLLETTTQEYRAKAYASYIVTNQHQLGLTNKDSGLLDTAKYIQGISTVPLRNPYTIHAKLQELWDTPSPNFQPPSQDIADMEVALNLTAFQEKQIQHVKQDIDLRIHPDLFGGLLAALDNRIKNLPSYEEKKAAKNAIKEVADQELQHLMHQFPTPHLTQLLDRIYGLPTGAPLSQTEQQLIKLLTHLLNTNTAVTNNSPLTEQEALLLHIARAIANCDAGQNRAIAALTRGIEKNEFKDKQLSATEDEAAALQLINHIVQEQRERADDAFDTENNLMVKLAGPNGVKQLVHQAPYVRNMLAPILGLNHSLYFDLHAEVISQELLKMSREELLNTFFEYPYFTPQAFATALQKKLSRQISEEDFIWIRGATELLTKFGHSTEGCFELEEDQFILTEKGAVLLLQAAGYVTAKKS